MNENISEAYMLKIPLNDYLELKHKAEISQTDQMEQIINNLNIEEVLRLRRSCHASMSDGHIKVNIGQLLGGNLFLTVEFDYRNGKGVRE